jgi:uncharacterized protein with ACT and thioredoxin-like domain
LIPFGFLQYLLRQTAVLTADGVHALDAPGAAGAENKRILIVDSEVSFFKVIELPHGARVTREFVELNYLHLSPFEEAEFCYARAKKHLLLWFYPAQQDRYLLVIPEGYLVWKKVGESRPDAICACAVQNKVKLFVVRGGLLRAQFVKAVFQRREQALEEAISWLKKDSSLDGLDTVVLEDSFLHQAIKAMEVRNLVHFIRIELDRGALFTRAANAVKWPLLLLLSAYLATGYSMYWGLQREVSNVRGEMAQLQVVNQPLKKRIEAQTGIHKFWESFSSSENVYPYFPDILDQVARIIAEQNGSITHARFAENRVSIGLLADNISVLMEQFLKLSCFEKVTVNGAVSKDNRTGKEKALIEGALRRGTKDQLANP